MQPNLCVDVVICRCLGGALALADGGQRLSRFLPLRVFMNRRICRTAAPIWPGDWRQNKANSLYLVPPGILNASRIHFNTKLFTKTGYS